MWKRRAWTSDSEKWILIFVAGEKSLSVVEDAEAFKMLFKKHLKEEKRSQWLEKLLHGRLLKDTEKASTERTW